jgi:hypothetical protein
MLILIHEGPSFGYKIVGLRPFGTTVPDSPLSRYVAPHKQRSLVNHTGVLLTVKLIIH